MADRFYGQILAASIVLLGVSGLLPGAETARGARQTPETGPGAVRDPLCRLSRR
jgi:hypothetical protein